MQSLLSEVVRDARCMGRVVLSHKTNIQNMYTSIVYSRALSLALRPIEICCNIYPVKSIILKRKLLLIFTFVHLILPHRSLNEFKVRLSYQPIKRIALQPLSLVLMMVDLGFYSLSNYLQ